jgi:hypothetical protein
MQCDYMTKCLPSCTGRLRDTELPHTGAYYVTPSWEPSHLNLDGQIGVVAVEGSEDLRFFALCCGAPGVVSMGACLKCCLEYCRVKSHKYVVC